MALQYTEHTFNVNAQWGCAVTHFFSLFTSISLFRGQKYVFQEVVMETDACLIGKLHQEGKHKKLII